MTQHAIVDSATWIEARKVLLKEEKALTKAREALAEKRRQLPWTLVAKPYEFEGESGTCGLSDLFGDNSQLIVQHFMFGPDWEEGCPSCSFMADGYSQLQPHLDARDVTMVAVSRALLPKLLAYRKRLGWSFPWVSSLGSDFNFDFNVSFENEAHENGTAVYNYRPTTFSSEEMPGISAFFKDEDGAIFHTYSCYARGLDEFIGTYRFLDAAPKGRDEGALPFPMAWVKRRDQY